MNRYSTFAQRRAKLHGAKVAVDDILNKEIVVYGFSTSKSKYPENTSGRCLTIQFKYANEDEFKVLFTGSAVLLSQSKESEAHLPFLTTLVKIDKYFSFS